MKKIKKRVKQKILSAILPGVALWAVGGSLGVSQTARAGTFEFSVGVSYNRTNYSADNYSWTRRYGGSIAYHFWSSSSVEWAYQLITERTYMAGLQDTTFRDQIYSLNWVQSLADRNAVIAPYFKVGLGQLNRDATGTYAGGVAPPAFLDALTGVMAAGLRVSITRGFGIRLEATSYLQKFQLSEWDRNIGVTAGTSFYF